MELYHILGEKRDLVDLPIFEAIETDERPYIILREITNILEGFRHLQTCRRLSLNLIKLPHSNLLFVVEGEVDAGFNNKCCVGRDVGWFI